MTENQQIAQTISDQIGRPAFVMMGGKNLIACERALAFKIGRNANKVTHVQVTLDDSDTYTIEFLRCSTNPRVKEMRKVISEVSGVYVDQMKGAIERGTGMFLSL